MNSFQIGFQNVGRSTLHNVAAKQIANFVSGNFSKLLQSNTQTSRQGNWHTKWCPNLLPVHSFCNSLNPPAPSRAKNGSKHNSRDCNPFNGYSNDSKYCSCPVISPFFSSWARPVFRRNFSN